MALRIVLVRTHNPGNIGAAARAAKNFGAKISLLGPRTDPLHPDAISFASGAEDLLRKVDILPAWGDLLDRTGTLVAMTSLRGRATLTPPFSANLNGSTAVLGQYKMRPGSDGHFVVFEIPAAETQSAQFLGTLATTGVATVVAP